MPLLNWRCLAVAVLLLGGVLVGHARANDPPNVSSSEPVNSDFSLSSIPALRDNDIQMNLWGWGYYADSNQDENKTSWGSELELDVTKTFAHRVAISADWEFVDYDDQKRGNLEQLFVSVLLDRDAGILLTAGKFNSPWGVEGRDYWDRTTVTPSLLFRAQPQDLRGVMLTAPIGDTGITARPFVVSGFNDENAVPGRASYGLTVEYQPNDKIKLGITNWIGPGLEPYDDTEDEQKDEFEEYGGIYGLTNSWWGPDSESAKKGTLYFLDLQAAWKVTRDLTLSAEYLLASSNISGEDDTFWDGVMALANYDIDDHWRVFSMWSYLNDRDGRVTGVQQNAQEVGVGVGYRINRHLELRTEYRHDFSNKLDDVDSVWVAASFGY